MKKLIFTFMCVVAISLTLTAQVAQDSTQANDDKPVHALPQSTTQPPQYQDDVLQSSHDRNMTSVDAQNLPRSIKKTLAAPQYKGWEKGSIQQDKTEKFYVLKLNSGDSLKTYRFDKNGKPLKE